MAISSSTVWEVRGTVLSGSPGPGADTNGGGFVAGSGGTDFSQQNAAQVAVGGGVVTSSITTTVVTFTGGTYTVLAGDVGNTVQFISGTNVTAGFYQIASVSAGLNGTWTLDRTPLTSGTTTNAVANMGGAVNTLLKINAVAVTSNKIYFAGSNSTTATIPFAQSSTPSAATTWAVRVIGYGTTRNDSTHATLTLTANTGITVMNLSGIGIWVDNLDVDCGSFGTSTAFAVGNHCAVRNCKAANFATKGISLLNNTSACTDCEVTGGLAGALGIDVAASTSDYVTRNYVHDNACPGINLANNSGCCFNIVANNSGASSDGIRFAGTGNQILSNTVHGNAGDGIKGSGANMLNNLVKNNLVTNNTGFGITMTSGNWPSDFAYDGNAYGGGASANSGGARNHMNSDATGAGQVNSYLNPKDVTLSASPYVGPTSGGTANFALNNTAGGGAACRAVGAPSTFPGLATTTSYVDMGAVQGRTSNTSPSAGGSPGIIAATG